MFLGVLQLLPSPRVGKEHHSTICSGVVKAVAANSERAASAWPWGLPAAVIDGEEFCKEMTLTYSILVVLQHFRFWSEVIGWWHCILIPAVPLF